jgi:exosortase
MARSLVAAVAIAVGALYAPTAIALGTEWLSSADSSYGIVLAAAAILLAFRRSRSVVVRTDARSTTLGLLLLLSGLFLYLVGMLGADVFLTRVSFVPVAGGALLFLAGSATVRLMAVPLIFVLLAIPPPALIVNAITLPLQLVASRIAEASLMALNIPVFRDGNVLHLQSTALEVAEACSGLRSLVSLGALAALLAWATERRLPARAAIVAASVPIAVVMNGLRVALTGVASEVWGPAMATGSWHTFTGWLTFVASLTTLMLLRRAAHAAVDGWPRHHAPAVPA